MRKFSLLPRWMVLGGNKSKIFKTRGVTSDTTDYGIVTGTEVIENRKGFENIRIGKYWIDGFQGLFIDDRDWWVTYSDVTMEVIGINGWRAEQMTSGDCGIRLAMTYSSIDDLQKNEGSIVKRAEDGILEIEYGYYPQKVVKGKTEIELEKLYISNSLNKTQNKYSTYKDGFIDGVRRNSYENEEYEYNGKRYVRFDLHKNNHNCDTEYVKNPDGKFRDYVWFEVQPVKWLVDEEYKLMVTDKIILGGIHYNGNKEIELNEEGYKNTFVRRFVNNHLEKELFKCNLEKIRPEEIGNEKISQKRSDNREDFER